MKNRILLFKTATQLAGLLDDYFIYIQGEYHLEKKPRKATVKTAASAEQKIWDREPEPATFSGLALWLGFNSLKDFEDYEQNGRFGAMLKRSRLRIEAIYETRLHQNPTGAMFALKSMGWNEKPEEQAITEGTGTLKVEITSSGPHPAGSEKDVEL